MFIIKNKKIFIAISLLLVILSIFSIFYFSIKVGIDFKGGALTEVYYEGDRPEQEIINSKVQELNLGSVLIQPVNNAEGNLGYLLKSKELTDEGYNDLLKGLEIPGSIIKESSFNSIGPSVGMELTRKAIVAVSLVVIILILFIAYAFRKVSRPISSWKYGIIAIVALIHDVLITVGFFSLLSFYKGVEMDTLFVVALLTILGLSVSDTIVIFDRIRENLHSKNNLNQEDFEKIVGNSLNQSFVRSLATSLTVILVLISLVIWGPINTKYFALTLTVGLFIGTYSSLFLASPLLVLISSFKKKN